MWRGGSYCSHRRVWLLTSLLLVLLILALPTNAARAQSAPGGNWTGFYAGVNGGYGWGHKELDSSLNGLPNGFALANGQAAFFNNQFGQQETQCHIATGLNCQLPSLSAASAAPGINSLSMEGGLVGGHIGYNHRSGLWVFGVEADADAANIRGSASQSASATATNAGSVAGNTFALTTTEIQRQTLSTKIDALGTLRERVGFLATPGLLLYGTGGLAWGHARELLSVTEDSQVSLVTTGVVTLNVAAAAHSADTFKADQTLFGWSAGGGVESKLTALGWNNVTVRAEYLHYDFGDKTAQFSDGHGNVILAKEKLSVDAVRGGLTWQFK